jgi:BirA family transcriptional regulator, biotin operon repressor / biotin---[acetyl-CoA-carboxylase] ligase
MIIGSKHLFFESLTSTNTFTRELLNENELPEGAIIQAGFQTAGRGQKGNGWESERGKNLLVSILLFPSMIQPSDQFLISMFVSLGVCDFVKRFELPCSIKWPNDIYVKDDKIAGILIENTISGNEISNSIAGIGININQISFQSDAPNPVSLGILTGVVYDLGTCLDQIASDLDRRYKQLIAGDTRKIREEYTSALYLMDRQASFHDSNGQFKGHITGVTDDGRIMIRDLKGRIRKYSFKEVGFIH